MVLIDNCWVQIHVIERCFDRPRTASFSRRDVFQVQSYLGVAGWYACALFAPKLTDLYREARMSTCGKSVKDFPANFPGGPSIEKASFRSSEKARGTPMCLFVAEF